MEKLNYDIRHAWIILIEELVRNKHLEDAKGGLRATNEVYDLLIEEDCKAGDHSNALEISYEMEAAGRMATNFHFNCLLSMLCHVLLYGSDVERDLQHLLEVDDIALIINSNHRPRCVIGFISQIIRLLKLEDSKRNILAIADRGLELLSTTFIFSFLVALVLYFPVASHEVKVHH